MSRSTVGDLADAVRAEVDALDRELAEVAMLAQQAANEFERHDGRRAQAADRLAAASRESGDPAEVAELATQLTTVARRAGLMEAQVEVLEGKRKAFARHRDSLARIVAALDGAAETLPFGAPSAASDHAPAPTIPDDRALVATESRAAQLVLGAQEDLRREIARAMHDGPAQSLTNIVLEAQIVERLLAKDPAAARAEMHRLAAMVQATLDATKRFIFDVRPMVLDDLGLVPTLKRAARDRGRPVGTEVSFESLGVDRRLPAEVESACFRMLDEALISYLEARPAQVSIRLDWGDELEARIWAVARSSGSGSDAGTEEADGAAHNPALAAMIAERRSDRAAAAKVAVRLPAAVWSEIKGLAVAVGVTAELLEDGAGLRLGVPFPTEG
ncbi:MAG: hypothetical protein RL338_353 [Chloroflexota bacterium]